MFKKSLILFLIAVSLISCSTNKEFISVENINKVKKYKPNAVIYSLPQTAIICEAEITKKISKKGPFSEYASQFLGITDVLTEDNIEWSISNINILTSAKVDTTQIYVINSNLNNFSNLVTLSKEGFLMSINKPTGTYYSDIEVDDNVVIDTDLDFSLDYGEITVKDNYKVVYDTTYNEITSDTSFIKVPVVKKQLVEKNLKDQAEELADQILTLRDDRNALLVGEGDSDYLPDGKSLQLMLTRLDQLEEEYLSMFIGKTVTIKQKYYFEYIPTENQQFIQEILFRFSEADGVLDAKNIKGKPVFLEISSLNNTSVLNNFVYNQAVYKRIEKNKNKNSGLVYRVPEKVSVKITYKDNELTAKDLIIAQYGTTITLPSELFFGNDYSIEFYPKYGALKCIEKCK